MGKRKRFAYPPHSFVNVNTSPAARVGMRLKRMESRCSLIFHLCGTYQSTLLPLSALASGQDPHNLFISATVDLCEGGCWRESEKALPPAPSQHQSCHFSNYLKQSFPSPALHYLAVSPLSLSPHHDFLHSFSVLSLALHHPIAKGQLFEIPSNCARSNQNELQSTRGPIRTHRQRGNCQQ